MAETYKYTDAQRKINELDFTAILKWITNKKRMNHSTISKLLGKYPSFISLKVRAKNIDLPLLDALSLYLDTNMFEFY